MTSPRRNLWMFGWISFFTEISSQMIYPLIPQFLLGLGANAPLIGLIEGIAEATAALFKTISGALSDRMGKRKPFVFGGYALSALVKPLLFFATGWGHVLAVKFVERMGKAFRGPPRDALLSSSVKQHRKGRSFGIQRAMDRAGAILGPLAAMGVLYVMQDDLHWVFLAAGIPAVAALIFIPFVVEHRKSGRDAINRASTAYNPLNIPAFRTFFIANILFTLGNSSNAFLLLKAHESGITSASQIAFLWMAYNALCVLSAPLFGGLSDKWGRKPVIIISFIYYSALYTAFAFVEGITGVWLLFGAYGVYYGLSSGVFKAYIADLVPAAHRGTAYGVFNTGIGLALLPASIMMGIFWEIWGSQWAFLIAAGFSFLGLTIFWLGSQIHQGKSP